MNPIDRAFWYIESHLTSEVTLDEVAAVSGISRFHLCRAFGIATGLPFSRYLRGRRLTEAARILSNGAPDILSVALDVGYGSHEAFTRAFRDQFETTPEQVRSRRSIDHLALVEPIMLDNSLITTLEPPRSESRKAFLVAGFAERINCETSVGIPMLWQRLGPHFGHVPGEVGKLAYGVCYNGDDAGNFDYMAGVEVRDFSDLPPEFARLRIPEQNYLVFSHREHISTIRRTVNTIWNKWLPESGRHAADGPNFELYPEEFSGDTGLGGLEIWVPMKD